MLPWLIFCLLLITCFTLAVPYLLFKLWKANKFIQDVMRLQGNGGTVIRLSSIRIRQGRQDDNLYNPTVYEDVPEAEGPIGKFSMADLNC